MCDKNNQISQESTKRDFEYINNNENNYSVKKEEIKNALKPLENKLDYISEDKNYLEIYEQVECLRSNFIVMINDLEHKINEKTSIPSKTVKNLGSYLLKFQTIKSKIKGEIDKLKVDIPNLEKEIQNIHKNFKYASEKHKLNDEILQKYNSLPSMKKELDKIKKQLPVLEKTLESTKDINRKIKNISINRFGVATIKTIDKYINNFILKFNGIIKKLEEVMEKKNYHFDHTISKIFSRNRSRLKHIKTQLDDSKTTDGLAYWYNRLDKIVNNQNSLNIIEPEFFDKYDSFLDTEIGNLKSQIEKLIEEMKNKLLEGSNIERDWKKYCDIIKNFRKKLLRYLYQDNQTKIEDYSLESLFTVGLIRAFSEIYSEDFGIIKFSNDKYSKRHFEIGKEDSTIGVLYTVFGVIVGIAGLLLLGAALASASFLFAFLGIGLGTLAAAAGLAAVLVGGAGAGGFGVSHYAIGAFSNKKYNDSKNFEISRSDKRYIKKIKRK